MRLLILPLALLLMRKADDGTLVVDSHTNFVALTCMILPIAGSSEIYARFAPRER